MSNAVFPTLPGLKWGTTKTPQWSTAIKRAASGREARASFYSYPTYKFSLSYEVLRGNGLAELQQLMGFFNARQGSFDSFLYEDPNDHTATNEQFGTGNGTRTQFQLVRAYGGTLEPVMALNGVPEIRFNGWPAGTNFLSNASFEVYTGSDGWADGWTVFSNGTTGSITPTVYSGGFIGPSTQRVDAANLGTSTMDRVGVMTSALVPIAALAGASCCLSAYMANFGASIAGAAQVNFYDSLGGGISGFSARIDELSPAWQRIQVVCDAPSNAAFARVYFWAEARVGSAGAATVYVDAAQLVPGSAPADFNASQAHWSINQYGLVTFASPPPPGTLLDWSGSFYYRCRFTQDSTEFEEFLSQLWSARKVEFQSIKLGS